MTHCSPILWHNVHQFLWHNVHQFLWHNVHQFCDTMCTKFSVISSSKNSASFFIDIIKTYLWPIWLSGPIILIYSALISRRVSPLYISNDLILVIESSDHFIPIFEINTLKDNMAICKPSSSTRYEISVELWIKIADRHPQRLLRAINIWKPKA